MPEIDGYKVDFSIDGVVTVRRDQTVLAASLSAGIPHFHVCGGNAKCSTCRVLVLAGGEQLTPPNDKEQFLRSKMRFPPNVRLACQTYVTGESIRLIRVIRDETDMELYVGAAAGNATEQIGDEKELTLFFLDIRNFTAFIESNPPFDAIHIIRKLFAMFQHTIELYNGQVIETAGDGLYAVFGLREIEKSADDAVIAGFTILSNLEEMNKSYFNKLFCQPMNIGIGVHKGKVISGSLLMGMEKKLAVMGFAVNIAARLQDLTKELNNNFLISDKVHKSLSKKPGGTHSNVRLRGVTDNFTVWLIGSPYSQEYIQ